MAFERACTELRFFTEEELRSMAKSPDGMPVLVRILRFRHDPEILLESLSKFEMPPALEAREHYLVIDARDGEPIFRVLDPQAKDAVTAAIYPTPHSLTLRRLVIRH